MVVYVDLAFVINFCIDAALLLVTAALFHVRYRWHRVIIAAAFGSLYAVVSLFPGWQILVVTPYKLLAAFIMVVLSMGSVREISSLSGWRNWLFRFMGFLGVSAASGGTLFALQNLLSPSSSTLGQLAYVHHQVVWWTSLDTVAWAVLFPFAALAALTLYRRVKKGWRLHFLYTRARFSLDGVKTLEVSAFIDSGNVLKDPIAHLAVAILRLDTAKSMLPPNVYRILSDHANPYQSLQMISMEYPDWAGRWHLIPYQGIGGRGGVMLGIKPLMASMLESGEERSVLPIILAFAKAADFPRTDFECIIPATSVWSQKGGTEKDVHASTSTGQAAHSSHPA